MKTNKTNSKWYKSLFLKFTGAPIITANKIWLAGLKSKFDYSLPYTEAIGGPGTLTLRTETAKKLFPNLIFAMYEKKLGKGEDKHMSIGLLKYGKIALINKTCLFHPPHESNYFQNAYAFSKRELYSRLWLSKRVASVKNISIFKVYLHYYWYAFWRVSIAGITVLFSPSKTNLDRFKGKFMAIITSFTITMSAKDLTPKIHWEEEIENDLIRSNK